MQKIEEAEAHLWRIFNSVQPFVWQCLDEGAVPIDRLIGLFSGLKVGS